MRLAWTHGSLGRAEMSFKDRHLTDLAGVLFLDISLEERILEILLSILAGLNYGPSFERGVKRWGIYPPSSRREHEPVPDSRQFNRPVRQSHCVGETNTIVHGGIKGRVSSPSSRWCLLERACYFLLHGLGFNISRRQFYTVLADKGDARNGIKDLRCFSKKRFSLCARLY